MFLSEMVDSSSEFLYKYICFHFCLFSPILLRNLYILLLFLVEIVQICSDFYANVILLSFAYSVLFCSDTGIIFTVFSQNGVNLLRNFAQILV